MALNDLLYNFDRDDKLPKTAHVRLTLDNTLQGPTLGQLEKLDYFIKDVIE